MLVLERRRGERIFVGDDVVIEVAEIIQGRKVRLAIMAPPHIIVDREEVRERRIREGSHE